MSFSHLVEECWLKSVWKYISSQDNLRIKGWNIKIPPYRDHDVNLMETFAADDKIDLCDLQTLNKCRLYLEVINLSDITNGYGTHFTCKALNGQKDSSRQSTYKWTSPRRPGETAWQMWRDALQHVFGTELDQTLLYQPLGYWNNVDSHQTWQWYYCPDSLELYRKMTNHVQIFLKSRTSRDNRSGALQYIFHTLVKNNHNKAIILSDKYKATVSFTSTSGHTVTTDGWYARHKLRTPPTSPVSFSSSIVSSLISNQVPQWMRSSSTLTKVTKHKAHSVLSKHIRIVADGSYKNNKGTAAIIFETMDMQDRFKFDVPVPANSDPSFSSNDSYRCEMIGLYSGLRVLRALEAILNLSTTATIACDSDRALDTCEQQEEITTRNQHFDVARAIKYEKLQIKSILKFERVIGHADKKRLGRKLTRTELLNQECDISAKEAWNHAPPSSITTFEGEGLSLWHHDSKIYSSFDSRLREIFHEKEAIETFHTKYGWTKETFQNISWDALEKATKSMSSPTIYRMSKYVTRTLPVGHVMDRRKKWQQPFCPRCNHPDETVEHIFHCPHTESRQIMSKSISLLDKWLAEMNTESHLHCDIIAIISLWITQQPIPTIEYSQPIQAQLNIGWNHFMEGRMHTSLVSYMDGHYASISSRKTGITWCSMLIQRLWTTLFYDQWKIRNECVHGMNKRTNATREHINLNTQIKKAYEMHRAIPFLYQDQHLVDRPISNQIKKPTAQKRAWLEDVKLAIEDRDTAHLRETHHSSDLMHRFLKHGTFSRRKPVRRKRRVSNLRRKKLTSAYERWEKRQKQKKKFK